MALVYLLASDDAEIVGIASTAGNVPVDRSAPTIWDCSSSAGRDVPVSKGSERPLATPLRTAEDTHGPEGLGTRGCPPTDGSSPTTTPRDAWVRAAHEHPGELVGMVTGPLTNLALALRIEPACRSCCGGW